MFKLILDIHGISREKYVVGFGDYFMADRKKILVVDDNKAYLNILKYGLENAGYQVVGSTDGMSALYLARQEKPDCIILDIMLPEMDGHKVCRLLRHDQSLSHIPVLIITSRDTYEEKYLAQEDGANAFLTKPITINEMLEVLQNYVKV